jgi:hypothetical protein
MLIIFRVFIELHAPSRRELLIKYLIFIKYLKFVKSLILLIKGNLNDTSNKTEFTENEIFKWNSNDIFYNRNAELF